MRNYKLIIILIFSLVTTQLLVFADDFTLPTSHPEDYYQSITQTKQWGENKFFCTWNKNSQWHIENSITPTDIIATKAFIYYNGQWEDADESQYVIARDQDNAYIDLSAPKGLHNFDTVYCIFVSYQKLDPTKYPTVDVSNKINNPDFEQGDVGFNSGYKKMSTGCSPKSYLCEGAYTVAAGMANITGVSNTCRKDHTGNGMYFMANGNSSGATATIVWQQDITDVYNDQFRYLAFSVWVQNWAPAGYDEYAQLQWYIDDTSFGDKQEVAGNTCEWKRFSIIWENKNNVNEIKLSLRNRQTSSGGNDFALDDLFFGPIESTYSFYRIFIGEKTDVDTIKFSLCPTIATDIDDIQNYIKRQLGINDDDITWETVNNAKIAEALQNGGKIELKATTAKTNYPAPFDSQCNESQQTSKVFVIDYTFDTQKEWKRPKI